MPDTLLHPAGGTRATPIAGDRTGLRAPLLVAVSFAVAAPMAILAAAAGEARYPVFMLAVLAIGAFTVGCAADLVGSSVIGCVFWLFFDGFVVHRGGVLGWDPQADAVPLAVLVAAGMLGSALGTLAPHVRAAWAGLRTARRRFRRGSLEPFTVELPSPGHPWFWN